MVCHVIAYDIRDDRIRDRVADALKDCGRRVQYSVFECDAPREMIGSALAKMKEWIDPETDSIRVYALCASCFQGVEAFGKNRDDGSQSFWVF